jgi:hypothetical protein
MTDLFYLPEHLLHLQSSVEKTDDNSDLQIYSYRSCNNESPDDLKAYRGLVFDGSVLVASSLGFTPEYNEETMSSIPHSNLSEYAFFLQKKEHYCAFFFTKNGTFQPTENWMPLKAVGEAMNRLAIFF